MHNALRKLVLISVAVASIGMSGCATVDDVKHAQATADQALSTAQQALQAAQAAQASADKANADITILNQKVDALGQKKGQRG